MHVPAILVNSSPSTWGVFTIGFCLIAVSLFFMLFKSRWSGPEPFKTWEWLGRFIFAGLVILVVGGVFWPLSLLVFAHTPQPNLWKPFSFFLLCLDTCVLLGGGGITLWVLQHTHQTPYDGAENAPSPRRWPWRLGLRFFRRPGL